MGKKREVASPSRKQASKKTLQLPSGRNLSLLGTGIFQVHKTNPAAIAISVSLPQQPKQLSRDLSSRVLHKEGISGWREKVVESQLIGGS